MGKIVRAQLHLTRAPDIRTRVPCWTGSLLVAVADWIEYSYSETAGNKLEEFTFVSLLSFAADLRETLRRVDIHSHFCFSHSTISRGHCFVETWLRLFFSFSSWSLHRLLEVRLSGFCGFCCATLLI